MTSTGHLDDRTTVWIQEVEQCRELLPSDLVFRNEVRFLPPVGAHSGLKSALVSAKITWTIY